MDKVRFGYNCINLSLKDLKITCNRGMKKKTFEEKGILYASQLALENVKDLHKILLWNSKHGIEVFRMTSNLFPWMSEYELEELPQWGTIKYYLEQCGKLGQRLSFHPDHFNKLASEGTILENTIVDLERHSQIMDSMGLPQTHWHKINIHIGGAYGNREETLKKFEGNLSRLSSGLRARLTIENDDKPGLFSTAQLQPLSEVTGVPIVFDYFHHSLHDGGLSEKEAFDIAYNTWDVRPVFHYSNSKRDFEDSTAKKEAHSDYIYKVVDTYDKDLDVVFEAKAKDLALLKYNEVNSIG